MINIAIIKDFDQINYTKNIKETRANKYQVFPTIT